MLSVDQGPFAAPLLDVTDAGLRAAIDADSIGTRILHPDLPHDAHLDPDAAWVTGTPMDPWANTVASADFDADRADARIAEIVAAYDALPSPFLWWRAPFHGPADLGDRLERARVYPAGDSPAMAMDLAALGPPPAAAPGLEIRGVVDAEGLRDYTDVLGADPADDGVPPLFPAEKVERLIAYLEPRFGSEPVPLRQVGYVDGRAVTTVRLSLAGGAAGIYSVATLEDHRGRGYGAAMTYSALAAARELGYRIATLQSSEMGIGIYQRLGFRELFRYVIHVHLPGGARFGS